MAANKPRQIRPGRGRPANVGGKRINVYIDDESRAIAAKIGNGNVSDGIRIALASVVDLDRKGASAE